MNRYSLWDSPWIPGLDLSGQPRKLSLRDALVQADQLREVFDPSPLIVGAVSRLLHAVLYRVFSPWNQKDWEGLWKSGKFCSRQLDEYGNIYANRFDLLNPERPFYQVPKEEGVKEHPISALALEAASGNNPTLFDHGKIEGQDWMPLDRAACYLVAHQSFAVGGGVSKPFNRMDSTLTKGILVHAAGRNLFESLLLNLIPLVYWERYVPSPHGNDCPFWEIDDPPEPERKGTIPRGPLHYLTWQSRRIYLCVDETKSNVVGCQIQQRYALPRTGEKIDPYKPYIKSDKEGWQPLKLDRERAVWRHSHVLLQRGQKIEGQGVSAPFLSEWLSQVQWLFRKKNNLPQIIDLNIAGLTTHPRRAAKIELWRREHLPIPAVFFANEELVHILEQQLLKTAAYETHLYRTSLALAWALGERKSVPAVLPYIWTGKVSKENIKKSNSYRPIANSFGMVARFWPALEEPFRRLLHDLPVEEINSVSKSWNQSLRDVTRQSYYDVRDSMLYERNTYDVLSQIEQAFMGKLSKIYTSHEGEEVCEHEEAN